MAIRDNRYKFIDGKHYVDKTLASVICNIGIQTLNNYRNREDPPPYDAETRMYPLKELGDWMREFLMFRAAQGGKPRYKDLFRRRGYVHQDDLTATGITGLPGMEGAEFELTEDQDIRLKRLRADALEVKLEESVGNLIPLEDVTMAFTEISTRVKMKLLSLPSSLSPLITGKDDPVEVQEIIEQRVRAVLEELSSDWRQEMSDEDADEVEEQG
jgi:hypothetical protein